jgi:hypothetical protein
MAKTVEVPVSLLRKMARAATAFREFEDELEDFLLAQDDAFIGKAREARSAHVAGKVRSLDELKHELCIE